MKIGIVTEYFYPTLGGVTENVYHFSKELIARGQDFRIITGGGGKSGCEPEIDERIINIGRSVPVFYNGSCGRVTMGFALSRRMKEILAAEQFDLLHLHSPLFPTLPLIANMHATVPVVATFHTCMSGHLYYKLYKKDCKELLERMAGRIAVSDCCAMEHESLFGCDFDVIPNGVDVDWWVEEAKKIDKFCDGRFNLLFLGRPDTRNGLDTLIAAFIQTRKSFPNSRLIIVGDGPLRFYFEALVPRELKDVIVFEGAANERRPDYLATADAFCFTPSIASFGITILEGMSAGKAIIASDIDAFRALVTHEHSALLVPPEDEGALSAAIERLIQDKSLRENLGAAAALRVSRFDWKRIADMQLEYYKGILNNVSREA